MARGRQRQGWNALAAAALLIGLGGCAYGPEVQRMSVEYNNTAANLANQLTLLNIVRAKQGMPLHYTAISQLNGSVTLKATSGLGAEFSGRGKSLETDLGSGGVVTSVTPTISHGAPTLSPSVGGEIDTGPSFTVQILDDQKFYQGITAAVPASTVLNLVQQGFDNALVLRLLVARIDIETAEAGWGYAKGSSFSILNAPSGDEARKFAAAASCLEIGTRMKGGDAAPLVPLSRVTHDGGGKLKPLKLEELAKLDGKALDVEAVSKKENEGVRHGPPKPAPDDDKPVISTDPRDDDKVMIVRPSDEKDFPLAAALSGSCTGPVKLGDEAALPKSFKISEGPSDPNDAPAPIYLGKGEALIMGDDGRLHSIKVERTITFRSAEGIIRYVGQLLHAAEVKADVYDIPFGPGAGPGTYGPVFRLGKFDETRSPFVSVSSGTGRYAVEESDRESLQVLAIIEQLVNLQKEATDRPVTVPVRVLP